MHKKQLASGLTALCLAMGLAGPAAVAATPPATERAAPAKKVAPAREFSSDDKSFLENTAQASVAEAEASRLASQKGSNAKIKAFGVKVVAQQKALQTELKSLASARSYTAPTEPSLAGKAELKALEALDGANFDKMYGSHFGVAWYEKMILVFQNASTKADDPAIAAFAKKHLAMFQDNLDAVRLMGATDRGM